MGKRTQVRLRPEVIIKERLKRGWSKAELARQAKIREADMWLLEDYAKASPAVIKKVADCLELQIGDFVEITPPE